MSAFEEHLNECLTALLNGERTLEECLALYPDEAQRLEPLLRTGLALQGALRVEPRAAFAEGAKERLLQATHQTLLDALNAGPRPSFARAARLRFLAAAQKMFQRRGWRFPLPETSFRAVTAAVSAVVLILFGFGAFVVTTSNDALPGDWRYPVKRVSENLRMTFTFSSEARRDLRLSLAQERLSEIEQLAKRGRSIGGDLLSDLNGETASLVNNLDPADLDAEKAREIAALAQRQKEVLASVQPLVPPEDHELLKVATETSTEAYLKAAQAMALALFEEKSRATDEDVEESSAESVLRDEEGTPLPLEPLPAQEAGSTEEASTESPSAAPEATATPEQPVAMIERGTDKSGASWTWDRVVIGRFAVKVPGQGSGWHFVGFDLSSDDTAPAPTMLRVANADGTAVIVINPRTGDTFWYRYKNGVFEEFIVRVAVGDDVWQASAEALSAFDPAIGAIVWELVNSIEIAPPPTPTATAAPASEGTATVVAEASTATPSPLP